MKVAPVSGDLLIKLALTGVAVGLAVYLVSKVAATASNAAGAIGSAFENVNPASQNNVLYHTATTITSAATGREETLGGWLYDLFNPDPMAMPRSDR